MKSSLISREILLFTGTSFSNKEWNGKGCFNTKTSHFLDEEAGNSDWPHRLYELLPAVVEPFPEIESWDVQINQYFIVITEAIRPGPISTVTSIDPRLFLPALHCN